MQQHTEINPAQKGADATLKDIDGTLKGIDATVKDINATLQVADATLKGAGATQARRLPTWVILVAFAALVGFLALIAWGLNRSQQGPIQLGDKVPAFTLTSFDGTQYNTTSDLAGKVILVNFWASWCIPCEQEAADMEATWQYYKPGGQVVFLGVDWVDTEPEAKGFISKFDISYINGPDLRTSISQLFRIKGVPETYILNKQGQLANVKIGPFSSSDEIKSMIEPLLK